MNASMAAAAAAARLRLATALCRRRPCAPLPRRRRGRCGRRGLLGREGKPPKAVRAPTGDQPPRRGSPVGALPRASFASLVSCGIQAASRRRRGIRIFHHERYGAGCRTASFAVVSCGIQATASLEVAATAVICDGRRQGDGGPPELRAFHRAPMKAGDSARVAGWRPASPPAAFAEGKRKSRDASPVTRIT